MKTVITVKVIHSNKEIEDAASKYSSDESTKKIFKDGIYWALNKLEEDNT